MQYPSPDVLASNGSRILAIECKTTRGESKYIEKQQIADLELFAKDFRAEAWIAIKFLRTQWYFISLENVEQTNKNYLVTKSLAELKGKTFTQLLGL